MTCCLFSAKPLSEPMLSSCQLDPKEHISVKFYVKFKSFHSKKCTWKYRLQNGGLNVLSNTELPHLQLGKHSAQYSLVSRDHVTMVITFPICSQPCMVQVVMYSSCLNVPLGRDWGAVQNTFELLSLKHLSHLFSKWDLNYCVVHCECNIFVWILHSTININSSPWILILTFNHAICELFPTVIYKQLFCISCYSELKQATS